MQKDSQKWTKIQNEDVNTIKTTEHATYQRCKKKKDMAATVVPQISTVGRKFWSDMSETDLKMVTLNIIMWSELNET